MLTWTAESDTRIRAGIYRIDLSHVARLGQPSPVYHVHAGYAFLGAAPCPQQARAMCIEHAQKEDARTCSNPQACAPR